MKRDYIKADSLDIKRLIKFEIWTADKGIDEVDGDADQQGWKIAKVMNSFDAAYVLMMELVDQYADVHLLARSIDAEYWFNSFEAAFVKLREIKPKHQLKLIQGGIK